MKKGRPVPAYPARGFTLVESIIVIVILAIAVTGIAAMLGKIFNGQSSVKDLQVRTRIMEECAEQVLAVRRHAPDGFREVRTTVLENVQPRFGVNLCDTVTAQPGYTIPTVSVTDYTGSTGNVCPVSSDCKSVSITQGNMTPVNLILVDY